MEFPTLGKHCKKEFCHKLDFLPISCDGCNEIFCIEHYSYVQHDCPAAKLRDNQVPVCPVCMKPVPSLKGEEDRAVSEHIDKFCKTDTVIYTNSCSFGKCKKRELVPFNCSTCKNNFCLKHRHFDVHECKGRPQDNKREILAQAAMRRGNQGNQTDNFRSIQGTMSEDEALARALAASMQQNPQQNSVTVGGGSSGDKKCAIS